MKQFNVHYKMFVCDFEFNLIIIASKLIKNMENINSMNFECLYGARVEYLDANLSYIRKSHTDFSK